MGRAGGGHCLPTWLCLGYRPVLPWGFWCPGPRLCPLQTREQISELSYVQGILCPRAHPALPLHNSFSFMEANKVHT